ncbi:MAG: glycosyltransferase [Gemmatimonadota bacterium]|nr:glycosyltransferase [Gemmatimonadota bacterium]
MPIPNTKNERALSDIRIAIVHEWLVVPGGSEQVLKEIIALFPRADVFCLIDKLSDADRLQLGAGHPRTSFLQRIPGIAKFYRAMLPFMPAAVESLDVGGYDLVISNSHAVAKGAMVATGALHVCHCCSPMRYAWDLREQYLHEAGVAGGVKGWAVNRVLDYLKRWDLRTSPRVSAFVANSEFIADRIKRAYNRGSTVVYSPVDTAYYTPADADADTPCDTTLATAADAGYYASTATPRPAPYIAASRLVSYKRIPLIVQAFKDLPDRQLIVIGDGPDRERVDALAGPNVTVMGWQPREVLREKLRTSRALIFAAEEDFGILPVEAQACGTPVIALGRGGALETVIESGPKRTGSFFPEPTTESIVAAVRAFEMQPPPTAAACRENALRFGEQQFRDGFLKVVQNAWHEHQQR